MAIIGHVDSENIYLYIGQAETEIACCCQVFKKMSVFAEEFSCINPARYLGSNCEAFSGGVDRHFKQLQKTDAKQIEWPIELL